MSDGTARALMAIYDAALSEEHWPRALDSLARDVGAIASILVAVDQVGLPFRIEQASTFFAPGDVENYFANYGHYDQPVMTQRLAAMRPGELLRDRDAWGDMPELEDRPDYKFLRERFGIRQRVGVRLSESRGWTDLLALQFDRDWSKVDVDFPARLDRLLPHLAKVVEVNRKFAILRERYRAALSALDQLRIGTCVIVPTGQVVVANREAQRIFALKDGLELAKAGSLTLATGDATAALAAKIRVLAATACGEGNQHEAIVFAPRKSGARPFLIEIAPLRDSLDELEHGLVGTLVFIVDPENHGVVSVDRLARLFALTEAEAKVCRHMIEGLSAREISDRRCVAEETVKSQVKAIYGKTNTRGRVELLRLAVAVDPPIVRNGHGG